MPTPKRRRTAVQSADTLRVRDYELLLAIHETGNLSEAAERVGITEPAASQQIRSMQRRLKVRLYDKQVSGDKLTATAHAVLPAAVDIVQAHHRGMHDLQEALHGDQRVLRVGASSFLPDHWHHLLDSVEMRLHRNVKVHLDLAYTEQLLHALHRRDLDVVLVTSPPRSGKLTTRCIEKRPFKVVFRQGHVLAKRESVTLSDLLVFPWIFFHRSVHPWLHDLILRRAELAGGGVRIVHSVNQPTYVPRLLTDDATGMVDAELGGAHRPPRSGRKAGRRPGNSS